MAIDSWKGGTRWDGGDISTHIEHQVYIWMNFKYKVRGKIVKISATTITQKKLTKSSLTQYFLMKTFFNQIFINYNESMDFDTI